MVGSDVELSCIDPQRRHFNLSGLYVYWQIENLGAAVTYYMPSKSPGNDVNSSYKNRGHLSLDCMKQGDFSLYLKNVTPQDTQEFTCRVFMNTATELVNILEEVVRLRVAGKTLKADISLTQRDARPEEIPDSVVGFYASMEL